LILSRWSFFIRMALRVFFDELMRNFGKEATMPEAPKCVHSQRKNPDSYIKEMPQRTPKCRKLF
jgi:hypothetical protein